MSVWRSRMGKALGVAVVVAALLAAGWRTLLALEPCPEDGFDGVLCFFRRGLVVPECAGESVPPVLEERFDRAASLIDRAAISRSSKTARRFLKKATKKLKKSARKARRAAKSSRVGIACAVAFDGFFRDARRRAGSLIGCDPAYPTVCIFSPPPDLDCDEVPHSNFKVVGLDPHGFDGDKDGVGCESTAPHRATHRPLEWTTQR